MITIKQEESANRGKFIIQENEIAAGEMTYVWAGNDKLIIDHTEVFPDFSGKGYGKQLVHHAIGFARKKNIKIIPLCPFAKRVISKDTTLHDVVFKP